MAKVNASINKEHFKTEIVSGNNKIVSDEPALNGGKGEGLSPEELLCASLAACTAITLRMYADKKQLYVEKLDVEVALVKDEKKPIFILSRKIRFSGDLDLKQKQILLSIADKCPIHNILSSQITIITTEV